MKTVKELKELNIPCHEIKPNRSKDRAMHERDNVKLILFSGTQAEKIGNPKNCENCKRAEKIKYCAMKWLVLRRIYKIYFFSLVSFIYVFLRKYRVT
jgi:hypothetical protein